MEQILKSPMAQKIVQEVSPLYGRAYTVLWLFQVIGSVLDEMDEWTGSIEEQVVPQSATWSLPYWEDQYKIYADPSWSIERRRQNILNKCRQRAPMNPVRMANIISVATGEDARVEELTGKNRFTVYISSRPYLINEESVRKEIDASKPAHLIYDIVYEHDVTGNIYTGGIVRTLKEVTLTQK